MEIPLTFLCSALTSLPCDPKGRAGGAVTGGFRQSSLLLEDVEPLCIWAGAMTGEQVAGCDVLVAVLVNSE